MARPKNDYINNKRLYSAMLQYITKCREAEENGQPRPKIPDYLGECFQHIADGLGRRPNFSGYSYLDEMKMDGILDCCKYLHNFNPDKYHNPFAYFTQIIWFAFIRRIDKEKKQQYIKYKASSSFLGDETVEHTPEMIEKMQALEDKFEVKK